jgi:hypothetical protein
VAHGVQQRLLQHGPALRERGRAQQLDEVDDRGAVGGAWAAVDGENVGARVTLHQVMNKLAVVAHAESPLAIRLFHTH